MPMLSLGSGSARIVWSGSAVVPAVKSLIAHYHVGWAVLASILEGSSKQDSPSCNIDNLGVRRVLLGDLRIKVDCIQEKSEKIEWYLRYRNRFEDTSDDKDLSEWFKALGRLVGDERMAVTEKQRRLTKMVRSKEIYS
eukprot:scaffold790_cov87-Skeletonema_dohrnii-CCMP3373.AAC.2